MKRYMLICGQETGVSGKFFDPHCQFNWSKGENVLTEATLRVVMRKLGGVDRGQGTRAATFSELLCHLKSPQTYTPHTNEDVVPPEDFDALSEAEQSTLADTWDAAVADSVSLVEFETAPPTIVRGGAELEQQELDDEADAQEAKAARRKKTAKRKKAKVAKAKAKAKKKGDK